MRKPAISSKRPRIKPQLETLDLRKNALRSIHFLENSVDPERKDLPYFWIDFAVDPPRFVHAIHFDDPEVLARWYYAIICAQMVAGTRDGERLRQAMIREIEHRLGPYGFVYNSEYTTEFYPQTPEAYSWVWADRSVLQGWVLDYMRATDSKERKHFAARIRSMVDGLEAFSVKKGKYVFFPTYTPGRSYKKPAEMKLPEEREEIWDAMYSFNEGKEGCLPPPRDSLGGMIFPLVQWYETSGDQKALDLAIGISNTIVDFHTALDNKTNPVGCMSNNHGTLNAMAGVLAAARHSRNRRHVAWARMLFEFYWSRCSSSFGWVTENESVDLAHPLERHACEGCATVDLVSVGIELAKAGFLECWDIVERVTRNYMTQSQATHIGQFSLKGVKINQYNRDAVDRDNIKSLLHDDRDVARRAIGCMAGWGAPNDILDPQARLAMCVQNCCGAHLPFGLYRVGENIVAMRKDGLFVNLLLNHTNEWCEVMDYQPAQGRVDVVLKTSADLHVRLPEWVEKDKVRVKVGSSSVSHNWDASQRYVTVGRMARGAHVAIMFPMRHWSIKELLGGTTYTTEWVGDTVLSIDPPGRFIPIFGSSRPASLPKGLINNTTRKFNDNE